MPSDRGQDHAIDGEEIRPLHLPPQDGDLVAESKQLMGTLRFGHVPDDSNAHDEAEQGIKGGDEHERRP
jgi:hypothetical protein